MRAMAMMMRAKPTKGVTLLELLLVLGVVAAMLFVSIRYYAVARDNTAVSTALHRVNLLSDAAYKWAEGIRQIIPKIDPPTSEYFAKKVPFVDDAEAKDPWNQAYMGMHFHQVVGATAHRLVLCIRIDSIPAAACHSLADRMKDSACTEEPEGVFTWRSNSSGSNPVCQ